MKKVKNTSALDRKIAEKIFNYRVMRCAGWNGYAISDNGHDPESLPCYSSNLSLAMNVFDHMRKKGFRWMLNADTEGLHLRNVAWVHYDGIKDEKNYTADRPLGWAKKLEDLPMIICKAAIKEIGRKDE